MKREAPPEEAGEKVPIWIISFADMITLLLAFFVMLQSMAHSKDATLTKGVQRSFVTSMSRCGLPDFLFESDDQMDVDWQRLRYPEDVGKESQTEEMPSNLQEDRISKIFDRMSKEMKSETSDEAHQVLSRYTLTLAFNEQGQLDEAGRAKLDDLARETCQHAGQQPLEVVTYSLAQPATKAAILQTAHQLAVAAGHLRESMAKNGRPEVPVKAWGRLVGANPSSQPAAQADEGKILVVLLRAT